MVCSMRIILLFLCAVTLLAATGCIFPGGGGGGGRGYPDHGNNEDHGWDHEGGNH